MHTTYVHATIMLLPLCYHYAYYHYACRHALCMLTLCIPPLCNIAIMHAAIMPYCYALCMPSLCYTCHHYALCVLALCLLSSCILYALCIIYASHITIMRLMYRLWQSLWHRVQALLTLMMCQRLRTVIRLYLLRSIPEAFSIHYHNQILSAPKQWLTSDIFVKAIRGIAKHVRVMWNMGCISQRTA